MKGMVGGEKRGKELDASPGALGLVPQDWRQPWCPRTVRAHQEGKERKEGKEEKEKGKEKTGEGEEKEGREGWKKGKNGNDGKGGGG